MMTATEIETGIASLLEAAKPQLKGHLVVKLNLRSKHLYEARRLRAGENAGKILLVFSLCPGQEQFRDVLLRAIDSCLIIRRDLTKASALRKKK